jgi:nicotinamide-nucleotide amidase
MARIPAGSRLLELGTGWVPGVAVDVDGGCGGGGVTVVILPGVPREFRRLVADAVEPSLLAGRNDVPAVAEIEHGYPESSLNLTFAEVLDRFPGVKLGSYPGRPMLVRLSGEADEVAAAEGHVRAALDELTASPAGARLQAAWAHRAGEQTEEGA